MEHFKRQRLAAERVKLPDCAVTLAKAPLPSNATSACNESVLETTMSCCHILSARPCLPDQSQDTLIGSNGGRRR
jgi:hypothetical protein